jgi:MFS family permease
MSAQPKSGPSAWAPFAQPAFLVLWAATVVSNTGTWIQDVGAGWLMTELSPSPLIVALVQAATTLPVFLFALIAGAVADIIDRRRMLLVINVYLGCVSAAMATMVHFRLMTPGLLVTFTFLMGTGAAFLAPAWQAIVPKLVSREQLPAAIALNSLGVNISRAIGPALAGLLIVSLGLTAPFILNAVSVIGIVAALIWWKPAAAPAPRLPREHLAEAMLAGIRFALNSVPLRSTLLRATGFFLTASAYWAMLPLIARTVLNGGAPLYGILLGSIGGGAVVGALILPRLQKSFGPDWTVLSGALGTSLVLLLFAAAPVIPVAIAASLLAGVSWISVLSTLNVSAQTSLPDWVRARGLSIFLTVFFGCMTLGSIVWGQVASLTSIPTALFVAAAGAALLAVATFPLKLNLGASMDLAPSLHWPAPILPESDSESDRPVEIHVRYHVPPEHQSAFLSLIKSLKRARQRSGAYRWRLVPDSRQQDVFLESWRETSWVSHLRHHDHVSVSDKAIQDQILAILLPGTTPEVQHNILTADRSDS